LGFYCYLGGWGGASPSPFQNFWIHHCIFLDQFYQQQKITVTDFTWLITSRKTFSDRMNWFDNERYYIIMVQMFGYQKGRKYMWFRARVKMWFFKRNLSVNINNKSLWWIWNRGLPVLMLWPLSYDSILRNQSMQTIPWNIQKCHHVTSCKDWIIQSFWYSIGNYIVTLLELPAEPTDFKHTCTFVHGYKYFGLFAVYSHLSIFSAILWLGINKS
jgi:hypothetical protein